MVSLGGNQKKENHSKPTPEISSWMIFLFCFVLRFCLSFFVLFLPDWGFPISAKLTDRFLCKANKKIVLVVRIVTCHAGHFHRLYPKQSFEMGIND